MDRVVLFEINSQDPEKAANFYSTVFGWKVSEPNWRYHPVTTGSEDKVGINIGFGLIQYKIEIRLIIVRTGSALQITINARGLYKDGC